MSDRLFFKPSGYFLRQHQVKYLKINNSAHGVYSCVIYVSQKKDRLFPVQHNRDANCSLRGTI